MTAQIGTNIRRIRESQGLLLRELAAKLEVSESYISQIETGKVEPKAGRLKEFADALGVTPDALYEEVDGVDGVDTGKASVSAVGE